MKQLIPNYQFNATNRTVTFSDFASIQLERVLLITNVTDNEIIYNFADSAKGGTVSGNILTLAYNTTSMSNGDKLAIYYETSTTDPDYARITSVETERKTWRRNFNGASLNTDHWEVVNNGAGQVINGGGGNLTITAGTTANAETTIRSKESFTLPFRVQFLEMQSQRIANNEFYLEIVNAAGNTYVGWMFDGTSTAAAKTIHMNGGFSAPASPTGIATVTVSSPTIPMIREIEARADACYFVDRASDSTAAGVTRFVKSRSILDPGEKYYVQIRVKNGAVAPASSTTYTVEGVLVQDQAKLVAEISGGRGNSASGQAIPVTGTVATTLTTTSIGALATVVGTTVYYNIALSNTDVAVKAAAGRVYGWELYNPGDTEAYVQFFNATTANVTPGATSPLFAVNIPPKTAKVFTQTVPISFATAITIAATTTRTGGTAPIQPIEARIDYL